MLPTDLLNTSLTKISKIIIFTKNHLWRKKKIHWAIVMKIAILYDSKFGNTNHLAQFFAEKIQASNHDVQLFRTKVSKPKDVSEFQPMAILVGGPSHFGKPARTLSKYIEKLGKYEISSSIGKAAVFNCNTGSDVCDVIKNQISTAFPNIKIFEKSLPIRTGGETGANWKEIALQNNWEEQANGFISNFLTFIS